MPATEKEVVLDVTGAADVEAALAQAKSMGIVKVVSRTPYAKGKGYDGFTRLEVSSRPGKGDTVAWIEVSGAGDVRKAVEASAEGHAFVVVQCANWKIIPLENLIADFRRRGRKIYAFMREKQDIELAFSILEKGVDGIVIPAEAIGSAKEAISSLRSEARFPLAKAKVKLIVDVGTGDRACIDTASQLAVGEGMLVGSRAGFFFLVHSETVPSEYIPTRPFRVNAGAIHSYVLGDEGKTRYLSELKASDKVRIVNSGGESRPAVVGRVKIERRPLMMVAAEADGEEGTVMLQKAETIRLVGANGSPIAVTDLKEGDTVLVHVGKSKARHFGGEVDEFVLEK